MFPSFFPTSSGDVIPAELGALLTLALLAAAIVILLVARRDADPAGNGLALRYFGVICLITLFVTLFAAFNTTRALTDLVVDHRARAAEQGFNLDFADPEAFLDDILGQTKGVFEQLVEAPYASAVDNNANYTAAVQSALVALTTGAVFAFHFRRRRSIADRAAAGSAAARVERCYEYGVCFVSALIAAYATARALFAVYEIVFPGTATNGDPDVTQAEGISSLLSYGLLATAAVLLFRVGWTRNTAAVSVAPARAAKRAPAKAAKRAPAKKARR